MPENEDYRVYNELFTNRILTEESRVKMAQDVTETLKLDIKEESIRDAVMTPDHNPKQIQEAMTNDSFYVLDRIEHEWRAVDLNLDGEPTGEYIENKKFATPIVKIESDVYEKSPDELRRLPYSIKDEFKENISYPIIRKQDISFLNQTWAAVADSGYSHTYNGITAVTRKHILTPCYFIDGGGPEWGDTQTRELKSTKILMHQWMLDQLLEWDNTVIGDGAWTTVREGWKSAPLFGKTVIVTAKKEYPKYRVTAFTDQQYMGRNYVLPDGDIKFEIHRGLDNMQMWARKLTGCSIQNVYSCAYVDIKVATSLP